MAVYLQLRAIPPPGRVQIKDLKWTGTRALLLTSSPDTYGGGEGGSPFIIVQEAILLRARGYVTGAM